jgi:hypothetical protein
MNAPRGVSAPSALRVLPPVAHRSLLNRVPGRSSRPRLSSRAASLFYGKGGLRSLGTASSAHFWEFGAWWGRAGRAAVGKGGLRIDQGRRRRGRAAYALRELERYGRVGCGSVRRTHETAGRNRVCAPHTLRERRTPLRHTRIQGLAGQEAWPGECPCRPQMSATQFGAALALDFDDPVGFRATAGRLGHCFSRCSVTVGPPCGPVRVELRSDLAGCEQSDHAATAAKPAQSLRHAR